MNVNPTATTTAAGWQGLIALLAAGLVVYLAALTLFTLARLLKPPRRTYAWAVARGVPGDPAELGPDPRPHRSWTFSRAGLTFHAWEVTGDNPAGPVVIATHGWGRSRIDMLARLDTLAAEAERVILWDLPAHGETGGTCRFGGREADDLAMLAGLFDRPVVLYGHSLGAEISLLASGGAPVAGLVLESPYRRGVTPAWRMLGSMAFPRLVNLPAALVLLGLLSGRGASSRWHDLCRSVDPGVPLLVVHGGRDVICPHEEGEAIARAGGGRFIEIPDAGHDDAGTHPEAASAIRGFIRQLT